MLLVKTKLGVSPIDGIGLFADEFIAVRTIIWRFDALIDLRLTECQIERLEAPPRVQIEKYSYREEHSGLYVLCGDDARDSSIMRRIRIVTTYFIIRSRN